MMKRQDENFYESKFMIDICRNPCPIHIQPTNRPNGCFVVIFKVFYDIHKSSLNKKNEEEEETSEMLGLGLKHTTTCGCNKCRKL